MTSELAKNWWAVVLRGVAGVILGAIAITRPGMTLVMLIGFFGTYALADGLLAIVEAWRASRAEEPRAPLLVEGAVDICTGLAVLFWPAITVKVLLLTIAAWAVVKGLFEVIAAIRLRKMIRGEWLLALSGALSILFGVTVIAEPIASVFDLALWVGVYSFSFGLVLIALGFRLRYRMNHPGVSGPAALGVH